MFRMDTNPRGSEVAQKPQTGQRRHIVGHIFSSIHYIFLKLCQNMETIAMDKKFVFLTLKKLRFASRAYFYG